MAKRLFSMMLVIALLVSLMPQVTLGVSAEGIAAPGASEWCNHTNHDGWTEWTGDTALPTTAGKYYLSKDVNLTTQWAAPTGDTHLCLNGHDITQTGTGKRVAEVGAGESLSIYDCAKAYEGETYVGGTISGGNGKTYGHGIWVSRGTTNENPGEFNLYGGRISGNKYVDRYAHGGAVYLQSSQVNKAGGVFNMYGGELYDNEATQGGAVYLHAESSSSNRGTVPATFNMYGGKIWKNNASTATYTEEGTQKTAPGIGAVCGIGNAKINIQGGELSGNVSAAEGGAIYTKNSVVLTVKNATLDGNESKANGGAIYTQDYVDATVENSKITNNKTKTSGAIYTKTQVKLKVIGSTFTGNSAANASAIYGQNKVAITIKDSVITGNSTTATSAEGYGAAVYLCGDTTKVTVSGNTTISGNTIKNDAIADLFLNSSGDDGSMETLYVNELTGGDIRFGVKDKTVSQASDVLAVSGTQTGIWQSEWVTYVDATGATKNVTYGASGFYFVEGHYHGDQKYVAWDKTDALPDGNGETGVGYYLTDNVTITTTDNRSTVDSGRTLHLCLNGKTVSQSIASAGTKENSELIRVSVGSLYLSDCTTVYDENGYFVSGGKLTGGNKKGNGAALYINKADAVVEVTGIAFTDNTSTQTNEGYSGAAVMVRYNTTPAKFVGCLFADNDSTAGGSAFALREGGKATVEKSAFTDNKAKSGGAIYCTGATLTLKDCKITENEAKNASAINVAGTSDVTIDCCTITGNKNTSDGGYGAVNLANGNAVVKLQGKTVIYDNLNKDGNQQNVHLQDYEGVDYDVSGLTAGSKVGISLFSTRFENNGLYFSTTGMTSNPGYCVSDHEGYEVKLNETSTRLELVEKTTTPDPEPEPEPDPEPEPEPEPTTHTHKLCNDASCTAHGDAVTFEPWDKTDSLPNSGNYYLTGNVTVSDSTALSAQLNLCLNGKTITQTGAYRIYTINAGGVLTITDCATAYDGSTYVGGLITGGKQNTGSAVYVSSGTTFNMYGGRIADCHPTNVSSDQTGAAVFLHSANSAGATFNMYGGEITNCGGEKCWGGAVSNGGGNSGKTVYVNIYGGKIFGNTAKNGGAIRLQTDAVATIYGGEFYNNTATVSGGAIYLNKSVQLILKGGSFTGNTGAAIYADGTAAVTVEGAPVVQNNTMEGQPGNLYLTGELKMTVNTLTTGAKIGVSVASTRTSEVISTNAVTDSVLAYFEADDTERTMKLNGQNYLLLAAKAVVTEHMHNLCNDTACTDHATVPFFKWDDATTLPTSGNYYLDTDVTLSTQVTLTGDLNLCLNGHTIKQGGTNRVFNVDNGLTLSIADCGTTGTITGGRNNTGSCVVIYTKATFNLFGGKITDNGPSTTTSAQAGAPIFLHSGRGDGATFNMYGGEITGNGGENNWGGAVTNGSGNAGVPTYINMYGGKIYGNTALNGGAFRMENTCVTTIYGGEIYDNTAASSGGAIYLTKGAELILKGGSITGNTAPLGGGIYVNSTGLMSVDGAFTVKDNTADGKKNNVYLVGEATIKAGTNIDANATMGLTVAQTERIVVTDVAAESVLANFTSDSDYKTLTYKEEDKGLFMAGSTDHQHCLCAADAKGCEHTNVVWTAWEGTTTLPKSGNYYLTADVQLSAGYYDDYTIKGELNLCLNGFTITAYEGKRVMMVGKGGVLSITDCAEEPGMLTGGTQAWGAGVNINAGGTFNLYGGKISGNKSLATSGGIGAIYVQGAGATFNMYGGEISGNESASGTIYSPGNIAEPMYVNIYGGTIENNTSVKVKGTDGKTISTSGRGGALYMSANTQLTISGGTIKNNSGEADGGAIMLTGKNAVATITGGVISGNKGANGGAIITLNYAKLILEGGEISGNEATNGGGGIYISTNTELVMKGGKVSGNVAKNGGGIYCYRSTATFNGGSVTGNKAVKRTTVNATTGKSSTSGGTAGGAYFSGAKVTLAGTSFTYNKAESNGGAFVLGRASYTESGTTKYANVSVNIYGGYYAYNESGENAGMMLIQSKNTVVNMYGGTITGNKAVKNAGAIYVSTDTVFNMTGGTITGNHSDASGGAFYCYKSTANITGGEIHSNTATTSAGMLNAATKPCTVTIKNIKIYGHEAKSGGALVSQSKATIYVEDCEIYDNKSITGHGGAVFVSNKYSNGYFTNCKFYNNTSAGMGGAVYASDFSDSSYTNCEFYDNHAPKNGGGLMLYIASTSTLDNCVFRNNTTDANGGGITVLGNSVMKNVLVENNTAAGNGGGIYTDKNSTTGSGIMKGLEMYNCQIKDNTAGAQGGGFCIYKGCRVELYDTEVTGNKAATEGGAIWAYEDLELHNTTITGNTSGAGYAVYLSDAKYDGHSYFTSRNKMSGNTIIKDNVGGNMYMGKDVVIVLTAEGLGQDAYIDLTLDSGIISNRIFGAYNYEGGNLQYVITAGDRSITDPEVAQVQEPEATEGTEVTQGAEDVEAEGEDNTMLYVAIAGVAALIVLAAVAVVIGKKKKANSAESK